MLFGRMFEAELGGFFLRSVSQFAVLVVSGLFLAYNFRYYGSDYNFRVR